MNPAGSRSTSVEHPTGLIPRPGPGQASRLPNPKPLLHRLFIPFPVNKGFLALALRIHVNSHRRLIIHLLLGSNNVGRIILL